MDTLPGSNPMEKPPHRPLGGLDPADLLKQGAAEDTFMDGAAKSFNPPPIDELAAIFPQFEILELIGQGGMGAVYKVRQKDLDRIVALKILPPAIGQSPEFSDRFTREAKALAKLNHPGIVTLYEFGQQDGLYFILMEFVDGVNISQLMKTGRVSPREALAIVPQICDALQFAHDQGIVHRDIKPENILLDRLGRVKVADFGIAKVVAAVCDPMRSGDIPVPTNQTLAGKIIGTPQYMAPEQIDHPSEVDHRADIYALGVVFYQMLTGELPGKDLQAPSRKVHIDVRLDEIVLKAMEKNPEMRFQQASVMRTRVDGLQVPAHAKLPPYSKHGHHSSRRWRWLYLVMFPVGLVLGLAAGWGWASIAPNKYEAQAIVEPRPTVTWAGSGFFADQMQVIESPYVLNHVVQDLNLHEKWSLPQDEVVSRLISMISVDQLRDTDLLSIRVRHTDRYDAADICNVLARGYAASQKMHKKPLVEVLIHETAVPPTTPHSPNRRRLMVAGGLGGLILSPLLAYIIIRILRRRFPDKESVATTSGENSHQTIEPASGASAEDRTEPFAITSFILGICSLILWPLTALPAIVFGHLARGRIRKNPALKGNGFAIAGLSLGYFFLTLSIACILLFLLRARAIREVPVQQSAYSAQAKASPEAMAEPPKLRFVGLQYPSKERWHPDGSPVTDPHELALMREIGPNYVGSLSKGDTIRGMDFWFSHPLLESWDTTEFEFLDESGSVATKPSSVNGNWAETLRDSGRLGWSVKTLAVDITHPLNFRLNYTVGPLERVHEHIVDPKSSGSSFKDGNTVITSVGQNVGGEAFLALAVDEATQGVRRFGVIAVTKDGRSIEGHSHSRGGPGPPLVITFGFNIPIAEVAKFRIGTRPLRTVVWNDVAVSAKGAVLEGDEMSATKTSVGALADRWLTGIDAGDYARSWKEAAEFFQKAVTAEAWGIALTTFRKPLGAVKTRKIRNMKETNTLPGAPDGKYWVIQFDSSFAEKAEAVETVTFMLEKNGAWKAAGYFIR